VSVTLDEIILWGRSRREYELMFDLSRADMGKRILGCGDGPASFNAEMAAHGYRVVSVDPIYAFPGADIQARFNDSSDMLLDQVRASLDKWNWRFHQNPEGLLANRKNALMKFLADYENGKREGRYLTAALPALPFSDGQFDLAICSHLLFLYSEQLSEDFHIQSVRELCRVANEVRVFPLLSLSHQRSPHLAPVLAWLDRVGWTGKIMRVGYEFQKGGNEMLQIRRR